MFSKFLRRMTSLCKHMYSAIYDVMRSYLTRVHETRKFVMAYYMENKGCYGINIHLDFFEIQYQSKFYIFFLIESDEMNLSSSNSTCSIAFCDNSFSISLSIVMVSFSLQIWQIESSWQGRLSLVKIMCKRQPYLKLTDHLSKFLHS